MGTMLHKCSLKKAELVERLRANAADAVETFTACGGDHHRNIAFGAVGTAWLCDAISDDERRDYLITLKWAMYEEKGGSQHG